MLAHVALCCVHPSPRHLVVHDLSADFPHLVTLRLFKALQDLKSNPQGRYPVKWLSTLYVAKMPFHLRSHVVPAQMTACGHAHQGVTRAMFTGYRTTYRNCCTC